MYVRFPLSLRSAADRLFERGIRICSFQRPQPVRSAALRVSSDRHLTDRQTYKTTRSAALPKWQTLMVWRAARVGRSKSSGDEFALG